MSEVKKPAAKKSTGKGKPKHKKSGAKKPAQKQSVKSNPVDQALTAVAKKFVKAGGTKLLLKVFPYLLFGYFGNKMAYAYRVTEAPDFFNKLMGSLSNLGPAFENIWPSINPMDLLFGAIFGVGMRLVVYFKSKNAKKFRKGEEYGSARWGNAKDIEPYMDLNDPENNVILTQTEGLIMNGKPKGPKYARNKNILVIGGSGSGKTRFFVKPNIMQLHSSYVITDPKGTVLLEVGQMLYDAGYEIKVLNTINFKKSMHYNPFAYLHDEKDILKLVNTLIVNTKGEGQQATEDFWVKAEKLLYQAYIGYIFYECVEEEQNFITLIDMINASETREDDESFKNAIDLIFEELEADEPDHFAVKQYKKYKLAAGKTAKSILISCGARLAPFDIKELRDLTEYDEMELDQIGERKTALFMIMSDTDGTFNFILAMMQSQMFNLLCECADDKHHGKLPVHVRFLLDEFANIGQIPQFDKLIATIRSREISASIILQSKSQLKAIYKDNADTIEGNCDTTLFLGGKEKTTLKEMSEILGKETIDLYNTSDTRGQSPSYGLNYQKTGKELMSQDEIAVMDGGKCIMQLRGVRPFFSDKFDITKHKRYKELSDFDDANLFDVEAFLSTQLKMKKSQQVETYELGVIEDDATTTE
ncbi:MAG: type IV secretory system conjugative DNA transfer family protein [Clostridiales bacterium]|nr:type IV secretory system conjugative DNA transfer family protein [Clostridiales bacterium]